MPTEKEVTQEELQKELERLEKHSEMQGKVLATLNQLKANLENCYSSFPETKKFLRARGLSNVRELGTRERRELVDHLEQTFNFITARPESGNAS